MAWRLLAIVVVLIGLGAVRGGAFEDPPKVDKNPFKPPSIPMVDEGDDDELATVEEDFYFKRMMELHPVHRQIMCRIAGEENIRFAKSVLVKTVVEQFKAAPRLNVGTKDVEEAIRQLDEYWQLIRKSPGSETDADPLYEIKNEPIAKKGLRRWARKICSPDNVLCVDFDASPNK